jgi:hypothetical protein
MLGQLRRAQTVEIPPRANVGWRKACFLRRVGVNCRLPNGIPGTWHAVVIVGTVPSAGSGDGRGNARLHVQPLYEFYLPIQ